MQLTVRYRFDGSAIPFCAETEINGNYLCAWSTKNYEAAKTDLLAKIRAFLHPEMAPPEETVEVKVPC